MAYVKLRIRINHYPLRLGSLTISSLRPGFHDIWEGYFGGDPPRAGELNSLK